MSNERFFMEVSGATGSIVRLGDRFVNQQGIELAVSKIYRPFDSEDILVEFTPTDAALSDGSWHNELLMDCEESLSLGDRTYSRRYPQISLDCLHKVKAVGKVPVDKKIPALEYAASTRCPEYDLLSVSQLP